jgi:hypothetical protein
MLKMSCMSHYEDSFVGYSAMYLLKYTDVSEVRTASIIALMTEAVCTSETFVYFNETTQTISKTTPQLKNYTRFYILFNTLYCINANSRDITYLSVLWTKY